MMKLLLSCRHLPNSQSWASVLMISWERKSQSSRPSQHGKSNRRPFLHKAGTPKSFILWKEYKPELNPVYPFPHLIPKRLQGNLSSCCRREQGFLRVVKTSGPNRYLQPKFTLFEWSKITRDEFIVTKLVPWGTWKKTKQNKKTKGKFSGSNAVNSFLGLKENLQTFLPGKISSSQSKSQRVNKKKSIPRDSIWNFRIPKHEELKSSQR